MLIFVFICVVIAYRRKSTESSRVLKSMQEHMDMLELQVSSVAWRLALDRKVQLDSVPIHSAFHLFPST